MGNEEVVRKPGNLYLQHETVAISTAYNVESGPGEIKSRRAY